MNLELIEPCSLYAIEAVYNYIWNLIPEKYKLPDKIYHQTNINPFYDAQLNWSERLHYRLSAVPYPNRRTPWFILTWNSGKGLMPSNISNRRFETDTYFDKNGEEHYCWTTNVRMTLDFCLTSNDLPSLFEFQEHFWLNLQPQQVAYSTYEHSVLGKFPVSFNLIDCSMNKYEREQNTICALNMSITVDFYIVGREYGQLEEIPLTRVETVELNTFHNTPPEDENHVATDIITSNTQD